MKTVKTYIASRAHNRPMLFFDSPFTKMIATTGSNMATPDGSLSVSRIPQHVPIAAIFHHLGLM